MKGTKFDEDMLFDILKGKEFSNYLKFQSIAHLIELFTKEKKYGLVFKWKKGKKMNDQLKEILKKIGINLKTPIIGKQKKEFLKLMQDLIMKKLKKCLKMI